jgi:hypothetical protein
MATGTNAKSLGKVSSGALVNMANHAANEKMQGKIGEGHELAAREATSRTKHFHEGAATHHYDQADAHHTAQKRTAAIRAEPITAHKGRMKAGYNNQTGDLN